MTGSGLSSTPAPRMSTELQKRVATASAGAAVLILLVTWGGRLGTAFLAAVISLAMLYEYCEMTLELPDRAEKRLVLLGTGWLVAFINFWIPRAEYELLLVTFFGLFAYFLFTVEKHEGPAFDVHFRELISSVFGILYLSFLPLFLVLIRDMPSGGNWTIIFLLIVWAGDTGAYFVGKKYGKKKLYPVVSPKKTFEGALGGLALGWVVTFLYKIILFRSMGWGAVIVMPLLVGVFSQVGDFCESFLKRAFHKKDSGSLLPGHGGFLDRFDGVLFGLPIMYGLVRIFSA